MVLLRKKNESLVINNDITVTVVDILEEKVRIGIVAPKDVPIHRQEVYDAIHNQAGAVPAPSTVVAKPEDPWRPHWDTSDPDVTSSERRAHFLGQLAWSIREKSAKVVSLGDIAQTLIDAVQESAIDLGRAKSLEHLKELLVQSIKRSTG